MADDLGAVRRTPRPTGDRQTPETGPSADASATITPSPVSGDHPGVREDVSGDLSPEVAAALIEQHGPELEALADVAQHGLDQLRGKLADAFQGVPGSVIFGHVHDTSNDMQAFLELPDCTACEGTGKDDHATPFEAPYAVHFAGPPVKAEGRRRQLCMWCGHVLADLPSRKDKPLPEPWESGVLVRIEDGDATVMPYDGGELPPGCCALPDDEQYTRTASSGPTAQGIPAETEATGDGCTCSPDRCDRLTVNGQCQHCARLAPGQGSCPAEPWCDEHGHPALRCTYCDTTGEIDESGPDEAQETRAADWPAETVDTRYDEQEADRG